MLSGAPPFYSKDKNLMLKNRLEVKNLLLFFIQSSFFLPETYSHEAVFLFRSCLDLTRTAMFRCKLEKKLD